MSETVDAMQGMIQQMQATAGQAAGKTAAADSDQKVDFADALVASLNKIDDMQSTAHAEARAFERGDSDISISNVMLDMQKASLAFNMGVQVRDRMVTAYRQIMNMQI